MASHQDIHLTITVHRGFVRLRVRGDLDIATRGEFLAYVDRLRVLHTNVRLDFSRVQFIDAAGLRALEMALQDQSGQGWVVLEPKLQPQVRRVLEITETEELLCRR